MRPRVPRMPEGNVLADAPALRGLAESVAAALNRPPPDEIVVDVDWNAAWTRRRLAAPPRPRARPADAGRARPATARSADRARVGHDRNGDIIRGLFVGSAVNGPAGALLALQPSHGSGFNEGAEWLAGALMSVVRAPVDAVLWLEYRLLTAICGARSTSPTRARPGSPVRPR